LDQSTFTQSKGYTSEDTGQDGNREASDNLSEYAPGTGHDTGSEAM